MTIIDNRNSVIENKKFIDQFENLYTENFPIKEEREPFRDIIERIETESLPRTIMSLEVDGDTLVGGCITDYYPDCKFVMPVYLVVNPKYRRKGFGRKLFETTVEYFDHEHTFIEIDNPDEEVESIIDPNVKFNMYSGMGFKKVPILYKQPPLGGEGGWCSSLILMHRGSELTKSILCKFLKCFYEGLNAVDTEEFEEMIKEVKNCAIPN